MASLLERMELGAAYLYDKSVGRLYDSHTAAAVYAQQAASDQHLAPADANKLREIASATEDKGDVLDPEEEPPVSSDQAERLQDATAKQDARGDLIPGALKVGGAVLLGALALSSIAWLIREVRGVVPA